MKDLACIATCRNRLEAEILKAALAGDGIFAVVMVDDEGGAAPSPLESVGNGAQVMVAPTDALAAQRVLTQSRGRNSRST